jgi:ATP-dependent Clp protease ATP-binding subunit ClpC
MNWFDWAKERLARWKAQQAAAREWAKETFTPRALQVFALAHKEAERLNHDVIGTEHVLLGLIKLGNGVAVNVLKNLGLNLEIVRLEVEKQVGIGSVKNVLGHTPLTPRMKKVLETAKKEAKALDHTYIGTEHLLLGLLQEREGLAAQILKKFNVDVEKTGKEILEEITPGYLPGDNESKGQS